MGAVFGPRASAAEQEAYKEAAYVDWGDDPAFAVRTVTAGVTSDRHWTVCCADCLTAGDLVDADLRGADGVPYCNECFPGPTVPIR